MNSRHWSGVVLVGLAACWFTSCAPTQRPASQPAPTVAELPKGPVEELKIRPKPLPPGVSSRLQTVVEHVRQRDLLTTNAFWTIFHGILGLGPSVTLRDPESGKLVPALDYICSGGELRGLRFLPTKHGLDVQMGPLSVGQGHQDQFVAEMAQWGIAADRKFLVQGRDYTFMDFVKHSQMHARLRANQELSWTLVIVGQYLGTDSHWTNGAGEALTFEDLLRYELDAGVEDAPCGGTHRLFGQAWAYYLHTGRGHAATGSWREVPEKTRKYRDLARKWQNADGSFSTQFFRGPGNSQDKQLRINSTGHIFEWLALALSERELQETWVQEAANALCLMILDLKDGPIDGGSLYHAVHGLLIYAARLGDAEALGPCKPYLPFAPPPISRNGR